MKININNYVKIKLTKLGETHLHSYYGVEKIDKDAEGYTRFVLWEVMQYFGDKICIGCPTYFEGDIVILPSTL